MSSNQTEKASDSSALFSAALESIELAKKALKDETDDLSQNINILQEERNFLANEPITLDEYCDLLRNLIKSMGESFSKKIVTPYEPKHHPDARRPWRDMSAVTFGGILAQKLDTQAMCFYFPEVIFSRIKEALVAKYADSWPVTKAPSASERQTLIDELDALLNPLEARRKELLARLYDLTSNKGV